MEVAETEVGGAVLPTVEPTATPEVAPVNSATPELRQHRVRRAALIELRQLVNAEAEENFLPVHEHLFTCSGVLDQEVEEPFQVRTSPEGVPQDAASAHLTSELRRRCDGE